MITVLALFAAVLDLNANAGSTSEKIDQLVSELISSKVNPGQRYDSRYNRDDNGTPILILAVSYGSTDAVARLLKNGANPDIATKQGGTETATGRQWKCSSRTRRTPLSRTSSWRLRCGPRKSALTRSFTRG